MRDRVDLPLRMLIAFLVGIGIVFPGDGSVLIGQPLPGHESDDFGIDPERIELLGLLPGLGVGGDEVEQAVPLERSAQGETELVLGEVSRVLGTITVLRRVGEAVALVEGVDRGRDFVGAGLGDDVDETTGRTTELGRGALGDDQHFVDGVDVEGVGRSLTTALFTEERIVEIRTVDHHVVVDALLSVDGQAVAIRVLDQGGARGQEVEIEKIAILDGQSLDHFAVEEHLVLDPRGLDQVLGSGDGDLLTDGRELHLESDVEIATEPQDQALSYQRGKTFEGGRDGVGTQRHQGRIEATARLTDHRPRETRICVGHGDGDPGQRGAGLVLGKTLDDTGGCLGLGKGKRCNEHG